MGRQSQLLDHHRLANRLTVEGSLKGVNLGLTATKRRWLTITPACRGANHSELGRRKALKDPRNEP